MTTNTRTSPLQTVDRVVPDAWAVITPNEPTEPRLLVFMQGKHRVEIELSDDMATHFGIAARAIETHKAGA
ncbi:hypothetical protein [Nonomuraea sp. NPDC049646]|uniref:hypothetical protein n=1 Tax=unclassified Nonomuraea TaxID=2593643 RepID=UPI0037B64052